jgi:hypothetical protein
MSREIDQVITSPCDIMSLIPPNLLYFPCEANNQTLALEVKMMEGLLEISSTSK